MKPMTGTATPTRRALALALAVTCTLGGCTVYNTYEKCGFHGCPGDAQITAEIRSQINQRDGMEPTAITVQTLDHVVYLYGVVSSGLEINDAESIARSVPGVRQVINSMAITQPR